MRLAYALRSSILLASLAVCGCPIQGQAEPEKNMPPEEVALELHHRNTALRSISNDFAEQQKKTALLKRDRAMLARDAEDPMLSEEAREKVHTRLAQTEAEINTIEELRVKNRASFAKAAKDYESFAKKNLSEQNQNSENPLPS